MSKENKAKVTGFEFEPAGALLAQVISENTALGFAHERSVRYSKGWHSHDRLNLAFPRGGSTIRFKSKANLEVQIDPTQFMVMPVGVEHMQWAESTVWDNFALFPSCELVEEMGASKLLDSLPELTIYKRSPLLNDALEKLHHDAIFRKQAEAELRPTYIFVLHLIFEEIRMHASLPKKRQADDTSAHANQVLKYLENQLFEDVDPSEIADKMGVSRASLYRNFKSLTGKSMMAYVRHRRMEEARQLMKAGNLRLGDIAQLVGYEDLYTFSTAYKNIFGVAPSKDPAVPRSKE